MVVTTKLFGISKVDQEIILFWVDKSWQRYVKRRPFSVCLIRHYVIICCYSRIFR